MTNNEKVIALSQNLNLFREGFETDFINSNLERFKRFGEQAYYTPKQTDILDKLMVKMEKALSGGVNLSAPTPTPYVAPVAAPGSAMAQAQKSASPLDEYGFETGSAAKQSLNDFDLSDVE